MKISELTKVITGGTPSTKEKLYWENGDVPWLQSGVCKNGVVSECSKFITKLGLEKSSAKMMPANTVLIALTGATVGKVGILTFDACANQSVTGILPSEKHVTKFLFYYLMSIRSKIIHDSYGDAQPHISQQYVKNLEIPVPPIPEQQRIVNRIEEMFSQLDAGVETLKKTKAQLAVYRQAVLKEAFEGHLTEKWRDNCRVSKYNYVQLAREKRDNILAIKKLKPLKYEWKEDIVLPDIPKEWAFAQIGDIAWSIKDGPHYSPKYSKDGIPFITGGNVRPSGVDFKSAKHISLELHKELCKRCYPEKGDMLYTKGGTTGIARVNTYDREFSVWVHVAVIKYVNAVIPEYFQHVLNSPFCYHQSQKYTHGVGNQDLGLTRMINIIFPICGIEEQKQIVTEIESRLSVCDSIEQTVNMALQQAEAMRQSILQGAFEGRL